MNEPYVNFLTTLANGWLHPLPIADLRKKYAAKEFGEEWTDDHQTNLDEAIRQGWVIK